MARMLLMAAVLLTACGWNADLSQAQPREQQPIPQPPATGPKESEKETKGKAGVAGFYLCEGMNPDGSPYKGVVEIAAIDDTYLVRWMMADGAEVLGVGIRTSDVLSVSYFGGTPAVAVYRINGDRLVGEWTMGGAEGMLYAETLTRMAAPDQKPSQREPRRRAPAPARTQPVAGTTAV